MKLPELDVKLSDRYLRQKKDKVSKIKAKPHVAINSKTNLSLSELDRKKEDELARLESASKIKEHEKNLHPLKSDVINSALLNMPTKEYVAGLKHLVRVELLLTLLLLVAVAAFGYVILRNPAAFVTPEATVNTDPTVTSLTPTPSKGIYDPFKGRQVQDNRGNVIEGSGASDGTVQTKEYINSDLGFSVQVPITWKIEEPMVNGVKNTKISDPANTTVHTYISFQSSVPDCSSYSSQGTINKRDIYTYNSVFSAQGFVKYGNALCVAFAVKPGSFYVQYAGPVSSVLLPIIETFKYF